MPVLEFDTIPGAVLEKVIQYFFYKYKYDNATGPIPTFPIELDAILPMLAAANFLDT
jgi:transcription elongation factor B subunit 1